MLGAAAIALAALVAGVPSQPGAQTPAVAIDNDDIGGVVTGPKGPEAGVWVIAETTDLPTKYAKIVVTDDQGRYVLPDLPKAKYKVWVRGYGLVDSAKVDAEPGRQLNLTAVVAPNERAAAEYYPPIYWYSMLRIPAKSEFPGTGPKGNGIAPAQRSQHQWLSDVKSLGCLACHAMGTPGTRVIPREFGDFPNSRDAWTRRIQAGQAMTSMVNVVTRLGADRSVAEWANWTDRVAAGELPKDKPPRPQGVERNVVLTLWDWSDPKLYLHDLIATDRRNPTVNANGKIYGAHENSSDLVPVLDPVTHTASSVHHPVLDPKTPSHRTDPMTPSAYWGEEAIWDAQANQHNPMMDEKGRPWFTVRLRPRGQSGVLPQGLGPSFGQGVPDRKLDAAACRCSIRRRQVHAHRHLLPDPSPDLRRGRRQHAVAVERRRRRAGGRLDQPQDSRRDRRSPARAGLVAVRARHQRQRQARRLGRAEPAGRCREGQARRGRIL